MRRRLATGVRALIRSFVAAFLAGIAWTGHAQAQHLNAPANLIYTTSGALLVASTGDGRIATFQPDGTYVGAFATGTGQPSRLAIDKNQALFVGMANSPDVSVYDLTGKLLRTLRNTAGTSIAVTSTDYLVSIQPASAEVFNKKGVLVQTYTQDKQGRPYQGGAALVVGTAMYYVSGPATGNSIADTVSLASLLNGPPREREHFTNTTSPQPTQIAVDGLGHYYVAGGNGTVTVYSHFGATLLTIPGLASPGGIAVDPTGRIYVAETSANDVKVFDASGNLVTTIR